MPSTVTVQNTTAGLTGKTLALLEGAQTITGQKTFNLGAASPFLVAAGALVVANLDADKLDGQEGTYYNDVFSWTPVLTFATPGDVNVVYSSQIGRGVKMGPCVLLEFFIVTTTFTHTTAAGNCQITGCPYTANASSGAVGGLIFQGITKANYTNIVPLLSAGVATVAFGCSGSAQSFAVLDSADMPTGGTVVLVGTIVFRATA